MSLLQGVASTNVRCPVVRSESVLQQCRDGFEGVCLDTMWGAPISSIHRYTVRATVDVEQLFRRPKGSSVIGLLSPLSEPIDPV